MRRIFCVSGRCSWVSGGGYGLFWVDGGGRGVVRHFLFFRGIFWVDVGMGGGVFWVDRVWVDIFFW